MATRMGIFLEGATSVSCVSCHIYPEKEPHRCDLCDLNHATELFVIKNRSSKKMLIAVPCLKEMIKFRVTDLEEFQKWFSKLEVLKEEAEKKEIETQRMREEQKKLLEKKVIVRKKNPSPVL